MKKTLTAKPIKLSLTGSGYERLIRVVCDNSRLAKAEFHFWRIRIGTGCRKIRVRVIRSDKIFCGCGLYKLLSALSISKPESIFSGQGPHLLIKPLNTLHSSFPCKRESIASTGLPLSRERRYLRAGLLTIGNPQRLIRRDIDPVHHRVVVALAADQVSPVVGDDQVQVGQQ